MTGHSWAAVRGNPRQNCSKLLPPCCHFNITALWWNFSLSLEEGKLLSPYLLDAPEKRWSWTSVLPAGSSSGADVHSSDEQHQYNKSQIINDLLTLKQFTLILEQISLLDSCWNQTWVDLGVNNWMWTSVALCWWQRLQSALQDGSLLANALVDIPRLTPSMIPGLLEIC